MLSKAQVKYIQSLSHKKFREEEKRFIAEGPKLATEFISEKPEKVRAVYALQGWVDENENLLTKITPGILSVIAEKELERISQFSTPNQVLLVMEQFTTTTPADLNKELVIMLDGIQDPGNLGTIIRIADWFGVKHIICSADCADVYNPKTVQSTMGSVARVGVSYTDLEAYLGKQKNIPVFAAVLEGIPVNKLTGNKNGILLIGNESKGISTTLLAKANKKITIPKIGEAESLNAAVATGIILSHMKLNN